MMILSVLAAPARRTIVVRLMSVWRSSVQPNTAAKGNKQRFNLDADFSHIREEIPLFEVENRNRYRAYFALTVANFLFWTLCADLLRSFYTKLEREPAICQRQLRYEQTKQQLGYAERFRQYLDVYGYKSIAKYTFWVVGTCTSALFLYLLTRCVASIRLMPGGRHIKVELFDWKGGVRRPGHVWSLEEVSTKQHRTEPGHYITMRVRPKANYLIDLQGHFPNPEIFDLTVGVRRPISSQLS